MKKILVCDNDTECNEKEWDLIVLWNQYSKHGIEGNKIFISEMVEQNDSKLKEQYLEWIHEFGESFVGNQKIKDHFALHDNYSYWWSTIIAQKANFYEAKNIVNALKFFQFFQFFNDINISGNTHSLFIKLSNYDLAKVFEKYSKTKKIGFENIAKRRNIKDILTVQYLSFFIFLKSIAYLINKFFIFLSFKGSNKSKTQIEDSADLAFFDIFVYLDNNKASTKFFESKYWTKLIPLVQSFKTKTLWVHLFFKHKEVPDVKKANSIIDEYNHLNENNKHILIDHYINSNSFIRIFIRYIKLFFLYIRFNYKPLFIQKNSSLDFYPLFKRNWKESFFGMSMMKVLFQTELYRNLLNNHPKIKLGIYVQENQPWELALLFYWKKNQHGTIIGFPNSTLRYWDMRYYYHERTLVDKSKHSLPQPDLFAVNGQYANELLLSHKFIQNKIRVVEALRYLYLENFKLLPKRELSKNTKPVILILGDNIAESNKRLLDIISNIPSGVRSNFSFIYKPHMVSKERNIKSDFIKVIYDDIGRLLFDVDIVVCSAVTSAAIDSTYAGRPTIVLKDPQMLNISPVRGMDNINYFYDVYSFIKVIDQLKNSCENKSSAVSFFHIDPTLKSWSNLLTEYVGQNNKKN